MIFKVAAFVFKLDPEVLPPSGLHFHLGFAVRKRRLHRFDYKSQLA
jgi:hypothetical protein